MQLMRNLMNISSQDITGFIRKDSRYPYPIRDWMGGEVRVYRAVLCSRADLPNMKLSDMEVRQTALPYDVMD